MAKTHKHHIEHKSKGGSDSPDNLCVLSPYDHAYLHAIDFIEGGTQFDFRQEGWKLLPNYLREKCLKEQSRRMSGENNPFFGKFGEEHPGFGKRTPEQCEKISLGKRGKPNPKRSENLKLKPIKLSPEGRKKSNLNLEEYRNSGDQSVKMRGRFWWINSEGKTSFQLNPPGPDWQKGRKWKNLP